MKSPSLIAAIAGVGADAKPGDRAAIIDGAAEAEVAGGIALVGVAAAVAAARAQRARHAQPVGPALHVGDRADAHRAIAVVALPILLAVAPPILLAVAAIA